MLLKWNVGSIHYCMHIASEVALMKLDYGVMSGAQFSGTHRLGRVLIIGPTDYKIYRHSNAGPKVSIV